MTDRKEHILSLLILIVVLVLWIMITAAYNKEPLPDHTYRSEEEAVEELKGE